MRRSAAEISQPFRLLLLRQVSALDRVRKEKKGGLAEFPACHAVLAVKRGPMGFRRINDCFPAKRGSPTFCISFYGWNRVDAFFRAWRRAGFHPVGHLVWHKDYASSTGFLRARHEQAYLLAKGRPAKPAESLDDVRRWKYTGNVWHPTEKDVSILQPLIEAFSKPGDLVLDPFAGSGSTLVAAAQDGRRYLGIELERKYCELARERLASFSDPEIQGDEVDGSTLSGEVAYQKLCQWLRERNHHALAETVRQAMSRHPS